MSAPAINPAPRERREPGIRPGRHRRIERAPLPPGASLVETIPYTLTHRLLREVLEHRGCLELSGPGGTGKTFAVDAYFADRASDAVKIHLESRVHGWGFLRRLVEELGGVPGGGSEALMDALRDAVGGRHVYVYVDEADLLNRDSLRVLRYLRDQRDLWMAFVLVGTDFAPAYAKVPELWSRVTRRVSFAPLEGTSLVSALAAYHPFLAAADAPLLLAIDAEHCQGNWRVWTTELETLLEYAARLGVAGLTREVAAAALGVTADASRARRGSRPLRAARGARP